MNIAALESHYVCNRQRMLPDAAKWTDELVGSLGGLLACSTFVPKPASLTVTLTPGVERTLGILAAAVIRAVR